LPYDLICDGRPVPLGDRRYLLSPQDLAGVEVLPDLARVGVASLKIEGRLKAPEYVANITRVYRRALDRLGTEPPLPVPRYEMEMAFSRGLHTGWFGGINNRELVHARFGKKRGVYLGEVIRVHRDQVTVRLTGPLKPGDGVVFDAGRPEDREEGGRVYEVRSSQPERQSGSVTLLFGHGDIDFSRIRVGDRLWKTSDPALERQWRKSFAGEQARFQRPVAVEVRGAAGVPLTLIARDEQGHVARADSSMPLAPADRQPLTTARLQEQLGRLGGTPFEIGHLENRLEGEVMLPVSELNRLRREVVDELDRQRAKPSQWTLHGTPAGPAAAGVATTIDPGRERSPKAAVELIPLVRNLPQLQAVLGCGARTVYCDFENPRKYRDAVTVFRTWQASAPNGQSSPAGRDSALYVAPARIFKPGEEWQLEQVRSCNADGYLVRNYDHLKFFAGDRCVGDYSLNIANHLSADYFLGRFRLERVTASYDLNVQQLEALLQGVPPGRIEITVHQHMPMFHMEHCVFCAFLSSGRDYHDCGRPCDRHDVKLRDRVGAEHPVKADVGCRNTVFNARAQTGAEYLGRMIALGAHRFRIEFLNETPGEVEGILATYGRLLRGEISGTQLWRELKLINQLGVTRGQLAGGR
jgi:putative protease